MSEVPEHSYHDSESSESEKDSIDVSFELIIGSLEFMCENSFKYLPEMGGVVDKYRSVIDTLEQAQKKYSEFPKYLSINYDLHEINFLLQEEFNRAYKTSREDFISSLDKVFPVNMAEVNVPKYCNLEKGCEIPNVKKFQHNNNLTPDYADSEYMKFVAETKEKVVDRFEEEDSCALSENFEVSQSEYNPELKDRKDLRKLLSSFLKRKNNNAIGGDGDEVFFDCEKDLPLAKNILNFVEKKMKVSDVESLTREYVEFIAKENYPKVRSLAKSIAEEKMKSILEDELKILSEKLKTYEVAGEFAGKSLKKVAKEKRSNKSELEKDRQPIEVGLKAGDAVILDSETFPWLKEDSIVDVLHVEQGNNSTVVAIIDTRTEEAKKIEHKMAGYENAEKKQRILPAIMDKLIMAAKCVATSEDNSIGLPIGIEKKIKELYPFIIYAWKDQTHNAKRVYMSKVSIKDMPDGSEAKESFQEAGVTELVLFLGACDKQRQKLLLPLFTGGDSQEAVKYGAGK